MTHSSGGLSIARLHLVFFRRLNGTEMEGLRERQYSPLPESGDLIEPRQWSRDFGNEGGIDPRGAGA